MFDQASTGIVVCDRNRRFTRANDRYYETAGCSRKILLGLCMQDILNPTDLTLSAVSGRATGVAFGMSSHYICPDGNTVWVQNRVAPLMGEQCVASDLLCMYVDISARVRTESELRELNGSLEERVTTMPTQRESALAQFHEAHKTKMVGQLIGGIAHDFNNLPTPIVASLELIRRRPDDARSTDLTDGTPQLVGRVRNLVGHLFTSARRRTLKLQAMALHELVEGMHDLIEHPLGPTIEIRVRISERLPAVMMDPHQFELAIFNFTANARDVMGEGGRLEVGARTDLVISDTTDGLSIDRYVCLEVVDNDGGIPAGVLAHYMESFFSIKGVGKGTGLGLSMVQGLVIQSGGGLGIHSEISKGTRASIWLSITAEQTQSTTESCPDAPEASWSTHVLLVSDNRMVRYTAVLPLGGLGHRVNEAASAEEALGKVERGLAPDLLVTDHLMTGKTSVQLAEELRQRFPQLSMLVITDYTNPTPEQLNGSEVLTKPLHHSELAEHLVRLLETPP